jgi:hypothetical protein
MTSAAADPRHHPWLEFPTSHLSHHGASCCERARRWVIAMDEGDRAPAEGARGPRWLLHRHRWGPSPWPLYWCEAVDRETLDCGALSAVARELFTARGLAVRPAQLVQRYTVADGAHWRERWARADATVHWIDGDLVYHEVCAVISADGAARIWDASTGWWVPHDQPAGYGSVVAARIGAGVGVEANGTVHWGRHMLPTGSWEWMESSAISGAP